MGIIHAFFKLCLFDSAVYDQHFNVI